VVVAKKIWESKKCEKKNDNVMVGSFIDQAQAKGNHDKKAGGQDRLGTALPGFNYQGESSRPCWDSHERSRRKKTLEKKKEISTN